MNKIEKLIKQMCPNGIEYRKLFQITNILKGQQLNKEKFIKDGEFPVYNGGKTHSGFYDKYNQEENSVILNQGGSAGLVSFIETKFWASVHCFIIKPINQNFINNKFLFYLLKSKYSDISKLIHGTTIPGISIEDLKNFEIPIPPIEIQNEIVKILDTYTKLEAELEAELEARKIQYNHYRNKLLDFNNNQKLIQSLMTKENNISFNNKVEYKTISEICKIQRGQVYSKDFINNNKGEFPVYSSQSLNDGVLGNINKYDFDGQFVTWTTDGAYAGTTFYREGKFSITNVCGLLQVKNEAYLNTKYLNYSLSLETNKYVNKAAGNPKLMSNVMAEIIIPIPHISIQNKIVDILDKLESYSQDIQTGLPLKIKQRQKQYAYYRDLLLNFDNKVGGGGINQ